MTATPTANGHRTTRTPELDELPELPADLVDQFKTPITDELRTRPPRIEQGTATEQSPAPHWADELRAWWVSTADRDISESLDKVVAYGGRGAAYDLIATGHDLAAMNGRKVGDEEATELAILFYASSKLNRLMAAAIDGRRGSDDSVFDAVYYLMMLRRTRAVGGWPTV